MSESYTSGESKEKAVQEVADKSQFRPLFPAKGDIASSLTRGFTFRHAWRDRTKGGIFDLGVNGVRPDWNVFVSAGEAVVLGDATAGCFIGNARFMVSGVAPGIDRIFIRVAIEDFNGTWPWPGGPLALITDYLVVPQ